MLNEKWLVCIMNSHDFDIVILKVSYHNIFSYSIFIFSLKSTYSVSQGFTLIFSLALEIIWADIYYYTFKTSMQILSFHVK